MTGVRLYYLADCIEAPDGRGIRHEGGEASSTRRRRCALGMSMRCFTFSRKQRRQRERGKNNARVGETVGVRNMVGKIEKGRRLYVFADCSKALDRLGMRDRQTVFVEKMA